MKIEDTSIPGVKLLTPDLYRDLRGYFVETHRAEQVLGKGVNFVQGNFSNSIPYTLRGLHYQVKNPQGKLVMCMKGQIFDVALDVRKSSPTFGKFATFLLDAVTHKAVYIPPGFAHGFLAFSEGASVSYQCTTYFDEPYSRAIKWDDPQLNIPWPRATGIQTRFDPVVSAKDTGATLFRDADYCA